MTIPTGPSRTASAGWNRPSRTVAAPAPRAPISPRRWGGRTSPSPPGRWSTRIVLEGNRAVAVEYVQRGQSHHRAGRRRDRAFGRCLWLAANADAVGHRPARRSARGGRHPAARSARRGRGPRRSPGGHQRMGPEGGSRPHPPPAAGSRRDRRRALVRQRLRPVRLYRHAGEYFHPPAPRCRPARCADDVPAAFGRCQSVGAGVRQARFRDCRSAPAICRSNRAAG